MKDRLVGRPVPREEGCAAAAEETEGPEALTEETVEVERPVSEGGD